VCDYVMMIHVPGRTGDAVVVAQEEIGDIEVMA
jgi:hypothetical protein